MESPSFISKDKPFKIELDDAYSILKTKEFKLKLIEEKFKISF